MVFILRPAGGVMLDVAPVVEKVVLIPDDVVVIGGLPERTALRPPILIPSSGRLRFKHAHHIRDSKMRSLCRAGACPRRHEYQQQMDVVWHDHRFFYLKPRKSLR